MGEVPKWKIGCLNTCAVLAVGTVAIGIFAPKPPAPPAPPEAAPVAKPEPIAQSTPEPAPAAPKTLHDAISSAMGKSNRNGAPSLAVVETSTGITVKFPINENLTTSMTILGAKIDTLEILKTVHEQRPGLPVVLSGTFSMVDKFGNGSEETVLTAEYSSATISKINFDSIPHENAWGIADSADIHPAFK